MAMTGGCNCGMVRYTTEASPMFAGQCYCEDCRRTSGAVRSAIVAVPEPAVEFTGEVKRFTKASDHESEITRAFCPNCGSSLYSMSSNMPGVMMLKIGSLDDVEAVQPAIVVYASRAPSWDPPPAGMPAFPMMPPRG
ncbi:MAG: GFA family protein [Hyphomonadaceae bacterium]